jgi:hypothetical protein
MTANYELYPGAPPKMSSRAQQKGQASAGSNPIIHNSLWDYLLELLGNKPRQRMYSLHVVTMIKRAKKIAIELGNPAEPSEPVG